MIVKREDYRELQVFKELVPKMKNFIEEYSYVISQGIEISSETAFVLTSQSNILSTLVDIYFNNKYSNPSSSMMLYKHLSSFQNNTRRMIDLFVKFQTLQSESANMRNSVNESGDEDAIETFESQLKSLTDEGFRLVAQTGTAMLEDLKHIKCSIMSDYTRLELGVDIMKEYKRRKAKESLSEKDFMNEFTVRFKVLSNSDRQFIEKEKLKNARNRNGTANGGVSKKV